LTIENGVGVLTLNRPEKHNAFDQHMIAELIDCLQMIEHGNSVRVLVITAAGRHFCAGADLVWMQRMADFSLDENKADARKLGLLLKTLAQLSKPTIALVQGRVMGGGIGLVACADIVIASNHSEFCFSEVKLGLVPATIAPYVVRRIGDSTARRYFLTAEMFSATIAYNIKLVHEIVTNAELTATGMQLAK
jgi:methylglutaconyl-CoA hydratase